MPALTEAIVDEIFTYHSPTGTQPSQYAAIREGARVFAKIILANTPACADQTAAIRDLRNCVMTANGAVALNGLV